MDRSTIQEKEARRAVWKTDGGIISDFLQVMNE